MNAIVLNKYSSALLELKEVALIAHKLWVTSLFNYFSFTEHEYYITIDYSTDSMCNDDACLFSHDLI